MCWIQKVQHTLRVSSCFVCSSYLAADDAADVAQTTIGGGQGAGILGQGDEAPYISQERQERIQVSLRCQRLRPLGLVFVFLPAVRNSML